MKLKHPHKETMYIELSLHNPLNERWTFAISYVFFVVVVVYVYYRLEVNHKKPSQVLLNNKVQNVICFYMGVSW